MSRPIAKILFASIAVYAIHISAKAQDSSSAPKDTGKVRVVVMPGQQYNKKPARKNTAPSTSERSGANYGNDTTYTKPIRTTTTDYNTAPTTAERPGYQDYLHPSPPPKSRTQQNAGGVSGGAKPGAPAATVPVVGGSTTGDATLPVGGGMPAGGSSTDASTTTTTTTTTTTLPNGQKKIDVKKSDTVYIRKTDTVFINKAQDNKTRSMKAIYAEVGGAGLAISVNFDNRIGGERKGLGYRVGAGYFSDGYGNTVFTVPLQVSYLFTKDENNFIELAGGTTFLNSTGNNKGPTFIFDKVTGFIGTATLGYRYQPVDHKLNFRINFVPIFYDGGIIWAGGVSIGYNFK